MLEVIPHVRYNVFMLKDYLKEKNISTYRLAKETGIAYSTLNDLVNHKISIDSFRMGPARLLSEYLSVSLDEFYALCKDDAKATVKVGDVIGTIGVKGRRYYVDYELDGITHHDDICKVCSNNDCFVATYASWLIDDSIVQNKLEKSVL